jgi:hypothetical protein
LCNDVADGGALRSRFGVLVVEVSMARGDGALRLDATTTFSPSGPGDCFLAFGFTLSFMVANAVQWSVEMVQAGGGDGGRLLEGGGSYSVKGKEMKERNGWSCAYARTFAFTCIRWLVR